MLLFVLKMGIVIFHQQQPKKKKEIGIVRESQNFLGIGNGFYQMSNDRKIV